MFLKDNTPLLMLLDRASGINILFDLDFIVIQASPQTGQLLGAKPDELTGSKLQDASWSKWKSETDFLKAKKKLLSELDEKGFSSQTIIQKGHNHKEFHYPILSGEGKLNGIMSSIQVANVEQSSHSWMFDSLMDNIPHRVYFKDTESKFLYANKAMVEGHGYKSVLEILDKSDEDLYKGDDSEVRRKDEIDIMQTQNPIIHQEEFGSVKNGFLKWFDTSKFPYLDEKGNVVGTFGISHEITEQKKLDYEIREKNHELNEAKALIEQASLAKSQFLANISHEMKTPLNSIMGMIDMALETSLDEKQKMFLKTSKISSEALLKLINDLISASNLQGSLIELEYKNFNLRGLLKEVANHYENLASQNDIYFEFEISKNTPEVIYGNPGGLEQILSNILSNAIKFNKPLGSVALKLLNATNLSENHGVMLSFEISDTGIGIPIDKVKMIFDDFSKLDNSSSRATQGLGLGLLIAKKFIDSMNGGIELITNKVEGMTFAFYVILEAERVENQLKLSEEVPPVKILPSIGKNLKVLIVEDNLLNQKVADYIVRKLDFDSKIVSGGQEALNILGKQSFDFILMDVQMPELDGLETTKKIRNGDYSNEIKSIPIIACSAHENEFECKEAGMDSYVPKPLMKGKLLEAIKKLDLK